MRNERPASLPYVRCIAWIVVLGVFVTATVPATASAQERRVVVVPGLEAGDLAALTDRGAVGLLVPDAGPRTSGARARAALERGAVRNSVLGGLPEGEARLDVETAGTVPSGPAIVLGLPTGGEQPNHRRYPIAVLGEGYRGVLTSDSTRIPGLVSIVDVAPTALGEDGALGSSADDDPLGTLEDLDERIEANRDAKTVVLLLSLALIVAVATFFPAGVLPTFAGVLLANLALGAIGATEAWIDALVLVGTVAASLLLARAGPVVHGLLMAGLLAAYLVAMAVDERWVALSPLGPTQNSRFYGLSNLLATLLLVPSLAGAVLLWRRFGLWAFAGVAALSLVMVGGSSFGADGGGAIVLLVAFLVLGGARARLRPATGDRRRRDRRRAGRGTRRGRLEPRDERARGWPGRAGGRPRPPRPALRGTGDRRLDRCAPGLRRSGGPHRPRPARAPAIAALAPGRTRRLADRQRLAKRRRHRRPGLLPRAQQCAGARPTSARTRAPGPSGTASANRPGLLALSTVIPWPARSKQTAPAFTRQ